MDELMLLYVSIGVFSLMVIGLVLTIREFRNNIITDQPEKTRTRQQPSRPIEAQASRVR